MVLGIVAGTRLSSTRWPRFVTQGLHRNVSLFVLVLLALHVGAAVVDDYVTITVQESLIPFIGTYRPIWMGLGALSSDLVIAMIVTSLLRQRIGYETWRAVHWTAYLCWPLSVVHALGTGSDVRRTWSVLFTARLRRARAAGHGLADRRRLAAAGTAAHQRRAAHRLRGRDRLHLGQAGTVRAGLVEALGHHAEHGAEVSAPAYRRPNWPDQSATGEWVREERAGPAGARPDGDRRDHRRVADRDVGAPRGAGAGRAAGGDRYGRRRGAAAAGRGAPGRPAGEPGRAPGHVRAAAHRRRRPAHRRERAARPRRRRLPGRGQGAGGPAGGRQAGGGRQRRGRRSAGGEGHVPRQPVAAPHPGRGAGRRRRGRGPADPGLDRRPAGRVRRDGAGAGRAAPGRGRTRRR